MPLENLTQPEELKITRKASEKLKLQDKVGTKSPDQMTPDEIDAEIQRYKDAQQKWFKELIKKNPEEQTLYAQAIDKTIDELMKEYPQFTKAELANICGLGTPPPGMMKEPKHWEERAAKRNEKMAKEHKDFEDRQDKMSIDELIESCKDPQQKEEWKKIKKLEFPKPKGTVKIVRLVGGIGLNDHGELDQQVDNLVAAFQKIYPGSKLEVATIPYPPGKTGKEALKEFDAEIGKGNADVIIPILSGHGGNDQPHDPEGKGKFVYHANIVDRREKLDQGISSEDMKEVAKKNKGKKFMFFLDACYSGSATDDPLADEENVFGILTAASKKQTSMLSFVDYFSKQINAGKQLGEAYIRADAAIRGTSNTQDPAAVFKVDGQKVVVS